MQCMTDDLAATAASFSSGTVRATLATSRPCYYFYFIIIIILFLLLLLLSHTVFRFLSHFFPTPSPNLVVCAVL